MIICDVENRVGGASDGGGVGCRGGLCQALHFISIYIYVYVYICMYKFELLTHLYL